MINTTLKLLAPALFVFTIPISKTLTINTSVQTIESSLETSSEAKLIGWYTLTYQPDSTSPKRLTESMRLLVGSEISRFESKGSYMQDSVHTSFPQNIPSEMAQKYVAALLSTPKTEYQFIIIKKPNTTEHYDRIMNKRTLYYINDSPVKQNWNIQAETKYINGYNCQKALCDFAGRQYTAWFTREIPISDGPYKFKGLPGLIISINDNKNQYAFNLSSITKPSKILLISTPTSFITTTWKQFQKGLADYRSTLPSRMASMSASPEKANETSEIAKRKLKSQNNSIEIQ